jgi:hypothetical protein
VRGRFNRQRERQAQKGNECFASVHRRLDAARSK